MQSSSLSWPSWWHIYRANLKGNVKVKVNVKLSLCFNWAPRHGGVLGDWRYSSTHSLTSALDGDDWSASRPGRFTPRETAPGTHWIGGWVGPRAVLEADKLQYFVAYQIPTLWVLMAIHKNKILSKFLYSHCNLPSPLISKQVVSRYW
jgi:hypothetical protein